MRPVPISDERLAIERLNGQQVERITITAPSGDPTEDVRPVEALVGVAEVVGYGPQPVIRIACTLDDGDAEKLAAGALIWISLHTARLPMFSVGVEDVYVCAECGERIVGPRTTPVRALVAAKWKTLDLHTQEEKASCWNAYEARGRTLEGEEF